MPMRWRMVAWKSWTWILSSTGAEAEVVGAADGVAGFHAAAGHPHGEAGGVVVAAIAFLAHGGAAELAAPDDEGFIEQAA